jgi:hypothetical protein
LLENNAVRIMVQSTTKLSSRFRKILLLERATAGGDVDPVVTGMRAEGREVVSCVERIPGVRRASSPEAEV